MNNQLRKIARRSLVATSAAAALLGLSAPAAHAAPATPATPATITWDFTEVYSRTNHNPVIGQTGTSYTTGSFITSGLTKDAAGDTGYQILDLLSVGGWGQAFGLDTDRGEDNFLKVSGAGVTPSLIGFMTTAGTWSISPGHIEGPAGGGYFSNFTAAPVPEPSVPLMMAAGLVVAGIARRRRQNRGPVAEA